MAALSDHVDRDSPSPSRCVLYRARRSSKVFCLSLLFRPKNSPQNNGNNDITQTCIRVDNAFMTEENTALSSEMIPKERQTPAQLGLVPLSCHPLAIQNAFFVKENYFHRTVFIRKDPRHVRNDERKVIHTINQKLKLPCGEGPPPWSTLRAQSASVPINPDTKFQSAHSKVYRTCGRVKCKLRVRETFTPKNTGGFWACFPRPA